MDRTDEQTVAFVKHYVKTGNAADAYRKIFSAEDEEITAKEASEKGTKLLKKKDVAAMLERHQMTSEELSVELFRDFLLSGKVNGDSLKAAESVLKYKDKNSIQNATVQWGQTLLTAGAKVFVPEVEAVRE